MRKRIIYACIATALSLASTQHVYGQGERLALSGTWQLSLDSTNYVHTINLPGSTDEAGIGEKHIDGTPLYIDRPETWQLARRRVFIGEAWYRKEIDLPKSWAGKRVELSFERCMWQTRLWVNGSLVGNENSLCAPHTYDISKFVVPGKTNSISLCIDNSPYVNLGSWSHGYAPGIQTIWNGAIGELFLKQRTKFRLTAYSAIRRWRARAFVSQVF